MLPQIIKKKEKNRCFISRLTTCVSDSQNGCEQRKPSNVVSKIAAHTDSISYPQVIVEPLFYHPAGGGESAAEGDRQGGKEKKKWEERRMSNCLAFS